MSEKQMNMLLEKMERIAQANETIALMLEVLLDDSVRGGIINPPQVIMTQSGPVELG